MNDSIERTMFYGASPVIFKRAKEMRLNQTEAEKKLWDILKNKQTLGLRFKTQHPIDQFIADFYCHKIKLVIEVDGGIHQKEDNKEYDQGRTEELAMFGIEVIRFSNEEVLNEIEKVRIQIERKCKQIMGYEE